MKIRNTADSYTAFTARLNPNEKVYSVDDHGNKISKPAAPKLKTVVIPPLATVEIDDEIWIAANKAVAKRQKIVLAKDPVTIGSDRKDKVAEHMITTPMGDGVFRSFNPVQDLVKAGILVIEERPVPTLSIEEMRKAIEDEQGYPLPKEVAEELIVNQYNRICG
ncbi:MAG: hypothetical protein ACRC6V_17095 [Bacteroidales bacterium]